MSKILAPFIGFAFAATLTPAHAEIATRFPLYLAIEAVNETVQACAAKDYNVAVTVVDTDGVIKVEARGDGSPIHSQRFSFRKALTIVSMGSMFGVDSSGALVKFLSTNPAGITNIESGSTDLLFLPGAVLVKSGKETIGAIGVSGAPLSTEDELCARAGIAKIKSRLEGRSN